MKKFQPVIKWSGSKRSQVEELLTYFPREFEVYYEPFCGGASILMGLLLSDIKCSEYICSDINKGLIDLWNMIKDDPTTISNTYSKLWHELNDKDDDKDRKRSYFNMIRERYNQYHNPADFMFIMRTTTNGMPRYNAKGDFNNSFHITRNGINPNRLTRIIFEWSDILNKNNVQFICCDYKTLKPKQNDFVYLDPPYANTKGMYYGSLDNKQLFDWLRKCESKYIMSFDGISGDVDNTYFHSKDIYSEHKYILSGNSSFKRTIGKSNNSIVYESLYIK